MTQRDNPFRGLVEGRLATYFEEAFVELRRGRLRGAYDYALLALNATLFGLGVPGGSLFHKLERLVGDGRLGKEVLAYARACDFVSRHDRGITDMDISYLTREELREFLGFLERFYRSLNQHGTNLREDSRSH